MRISSLDDVALGAAALHVPSGRARVAQEFLTGPGDHGKSMCQGMFIFGKLTCRLDLSRSLAEFESVSFCELRSITGFEWSCRFVLGHVS